MLIDVHAHLWKGAYEANKRDILKGAELYHIDRVHISSLCSFYSDEDEVKELNEATAGFIREQPQLISGYCYVNPSLGNCMDTLKRGIEEQGMSGMKLWVATFCDDPRVFPLVEKCIDYDVPVLIHSFYKAIDQLEFETLGKNVANLARRYPEAKLIMAHLGANCYSEIKPIVPFKNVSVDISGSLFRRDEVDYTKKAIGAERIMFGSDFPDLNFLVSLGQVQEASFTPEERELVCYKNAQRIFKRAR